LKAFSPADVFDKRILFAGFIAVTGFRVHIAQRRAIGGQRDHCDGPLVIIDGIGEFALRGCHFAESGKSAVIIGIGFQRAFVGALRARQVSREKIIFAEGELTPGDVFRLARQPGQT
jgi:hypothetical protein